MATYRLKSKLYGEFDGEKKDRGILGTGISGGQLLMAGGAALAGRGVYRNMAFKGKIGGVGSQAHIDEINRRAANLKKKGATATWYNPFTWRRPSRGLSQVQEQKRAAKAVLSGTGGNNWAKEAERRGKVNQVKQDVELANSMYDAYGNLRQDLLTGTKTKRRNEALSVLNWNQ